MEFDDFMKEMINKKVNQTPQSEAIKQVIDFVISFYKQSLDAGFNETQAFELTKMVLASTIGLGGK